MQSDSAWEKLEDQLARTRAVASSARETEQFQAVGIQCREIVISLSQLVYDPKKHPSPDGIAPSPTDAKRMLESYVAAELAGKTNQSTRRHVRSVIDMCNDLQHSRNACYRDAVLCVEAAGALVSVIGVISGRGALSSGPSVQVEFGYDRLHISSDVHVYRLKTKVANSGRQTIPSYKLIIRFPDLDSIPFRWQSIGPKADPGGRLVEISALPNDAVFCRVKNFFEITYASKEPLLPHDEMRLDDKIQVVYRFTHEIYSNLEDIPNVNWRLLADNILPTAGTVPWDKLNVF